MPSLEAIIQLLLIYRYLLLFPVVVFEGPIITVISGFLVSLGLLNPVLAYTVIITGDLTGDAFYYMIGRYGRKGILERWGQYIGIPMRRVRTLEKHFQKHSARTLVVGKLSHGVGGVVLVSAGIAEVPFWKFMWYNFLPTLPKSMILLLIGYYWGHSYATIQHYLDITAIGTVLLAAVLTLGYIGLQMVLKRLNNK